MIQLPSGVKLSGPLISCLTPAVRERRHAAQRQLHDRLEMVPVLVQQLELRTVPAGRARPRASGWARSRPSPGRRPPPCSRSAGRDRAASAGPAVTPAIGSVTMYWCCTETSGTLTPASAARARVHWPAQRTTFSQAIRPDGVTTARTRPCSSSKPVTATPSRSVTPAIRAPLASAWAMSDGLAWPSVGRKAAPTTSSTCHQRPQRLRLRGRQQLHLQAERVRRRRLAAGPRSSAPGCRRAAGRHCASTPSPARSPPPAAA